MRGRTAILLTATVDPGDYADQSRRPSPDDRRKDYVSAIRFYTSLIDDRICGVVLCENSNHDFSDIAGYLDLQSVRTEFEILTFNGNEKPENIHYGYSELGIVDHAISKSKLLRKCDSFLKISGRLKLTNVLDLLSLIDPSTDFAIDFRRAYPRERGPQYRARTQIIYSSLQFYEDFIFEKRNQMIGVCTHIEEFIPIVVSSLADRHNIMVRFPIECNISGVGGSDNKSYNSRTNQLKRTIRGVVRKNLPQLWL
jgi:hypothetical protein